jgi:hypothetical protein
MIVLAILLAGVGLFLLCRLAFLLAIYALPLFTGAVVGAAAHALGTGLVAFWPLWRALSPSRHVISRRPSCGRPSCGRSSSPSSRRRRRSQATIWPMG